MNEDLKELAALQPETQFVVVKGESFEIKPFLFRNMFKVLSHISNMVDSLDLVPNPYEDPMVAYTKQIIKLLGNHGEDIIGIMSVATGKPSSYFDDITSEEGIELAAAIWKINQDFFARKLQPKLESMGLVAKETSQDSQLEREKNISQSETTEVQNQEVQVAENQE